jgi:hypothetical protein
MSLGGVSASIVTGGAQSSASGADLARTVVGMGVCTLATPNRLLHPSSSGGMRAGLGLGPLPESQALLWGVEGAPSPFAMALSPSNAGGVGSVANSTNATGTVTVAAAPHVQIAIKCSTGGTLGTAAFQFSLDGGITWSAPVTSVAASTWAYLVPGTFCTLTFAAATYVSTKTCTIGVDGTVTNGAAWVGVVTQVSSPIDNYDFLATCVTGGALGTATLAVSLDGGRTQYGPALLTPAGGVVVVPGTGIVLTCANSFTAAETHSFPCAAPAPSNSDITAAFTALQNDPSAPNAAVIEIGVLPGSAANAFTLAQAIQSSLDTAFAAGKDWQAIVTCPLKGDVIFLGGNCIIDTADDRATVKTARAGKTCNTVGVFVGTDNVASAIGSYQVRRPRSTIIAARIAGKLPVEADRSTIATRDAPLEVAAIGDDERFASVSLYDAQLNTFQSVPGLNGAYLTIPRGGYGWQNLTTDANLIDADGRRAVNAILAGFRPVAAKIIGRRFPVNIDGTIEAKARASLDTLLDAALKKRAGIGIGADFGGVAQVSSVTAAVDPSSNLGPTGDKVVKVNVSILPLGFASAVDITLYFQGA